MKENNGETTKETVAEKGKAPFFSGEEKGKAEADEFRERLNAVVRRVGGASAVAHLAGMRESTIRNWLAGPSEPNRAKLVAIARATGVSLAWLATGEGSMRPGGGRGEGAEPRQTWADGQVGQPHHATGAGAPGPAGMPPKEVFYRMAKVVKALVQEFARDEILANSTTELGGRLRLAYFFTKDDKPTRPDSQSD